MAERPAPLSTDFLVIVMDEMIEWTRKNRSAGKFMLDALLASSK